ncbi:hypothetical protein QBC32DRAFT_395147 [Pseudoneurospora amorphoporcata]|uniref:DUF6604 domain-containing protein n=1 Tax=Pseudoneurospora amorphoporcata TaxID=241081 RepID=A0AAN6SK29_9PEZI|nr:hypothetical protein QBC32DRAFT_395147 [Pseudoneurospora amorphoporcata]
MTFKLYPNFAYKRDIGPLVYWVLQTSNALIRSLPSSYTDVPQVPLDKPQITLQSLVSLSKLIGKHVDKEHIPKTVLALLQSVIESITASHATFQRLATKKPHPDVENGSASLETFVVALRESALALHGWEILLHPYNLSDYLFSCYPLTKEKLDCMGSEKKKPQQAGPLVGHQRRQVKPGKGKRGRRRKDSEAEKSKATETEEGPPEDVFRKEPLESFGVTLGPDGVTTDYIMAVYDLFRGHFDLRAYLQDVWYEVAYDGLNIAVAGALSNAAIVVAQRSEDKLLAGFSDDKKSYHSVMSTMSSVFRFDAEAEGTEANKGDAHLADAKEMFLVHAYHDLLDFVTDYRKNGNGKPTKRMMKEVKHWNPDFDLRRATMEERLKWRRLYTIHWLYHLVGEFTSRLLVVAAVLHKKVPDSIKAKEAQKEEQRQRLLGLDGFAALIKKLTYEDSDLKNRKQILPHHVFQLQCIVDSLAVTKGWTFDLLKGHVLIEPPDADKFRPMRDVNRFLLDIGDERAGFLKGFVDLRHKLMVEGAGRPATDNYAQIQEILKSARVIYNQFVGKPPIQGDKPQSHTIGPNVLWNYSPFLCGVGLAEALDFQFTSIMHVWEQHQEPVILMHLYNMLLREGYLDKPIDFFESLQQLFASGCFPNGIVPISDYGNVLADSLRLLDNRKRNTGGMLRAPSGSRVAYRLAIAHESFLVLLRDNGWNLFHLSHNEVPLSSLFAKFMIALTTPVYDQDTGKKHLDETILVVRARLALSNEDVLGDRAEEKLLAMADALEELNSMEKQQAKDSAPKVVFKTPNDFSASEWLDLMKVDIMADIDGDRPLCGLNLARLTCHIFDIFQDIEDDLYALGCKGYLDMCGDDGEYDRKIFTRTSARRILFVGAMDVKDEQILRVAARTLAHSAGSLSEYIYWDKLKFGAAERSSPETDGHGETATDASSCTLEEEEKVHMDECEVVKGVVLDNGTVWIRTNDDETTTDASSFTLKRFKEENVHRDECVVIKGVALDDGTVWVRK